MTFARLNAGSVRGFSEITIADTTAALMHICVVTPSFNQRNFLGQTLRSVLTQHGKFEVSSIVIDGGSTDGSVELLKSIADTRLRWISEPDHGQSDAVNKGLALAEGDVVGWLNSDDLYLPGALAAVAAAFADPRVQWIIGRYQIINETGQVIRPNIVRYKNRFLDRYSYRNLLRENFVSQPAVFWRREFGQRIGGLDTSLHYTMDYDLWLRMGRASPPTVLNETLAQFRIHAASKSGAVNREQFDEGYRVACRYCGNDHLSRWVHRFGVEKIVWAYRLMQLIGK
jgi:GT2 family glycosyltransferase